LFNKCGELIDLADDDLAVLQEQIEPWIEPEPPGRGPVLSAGFI
jgi:hypothetical protein